MNPTPDINTFTKSKDLMQNTSPLFNNSLISPYKNVRGWGRSSCLRHYDALRSKIDMWLNSKTTIPQYQYLSILQHRVTQRSQNRSPTFIFKGRRPEVLSKKNIEKNLSKFVFWLELSKIFRRDGFKNIFEWLLFIHYAWLNSL